MHPYENPVCFIGLDDVGDGFTDSADASCQAHWPYWEADPRCGLGAELAFLLGWIRRRVRRC